MYAESLLPAAALQRLHQDKRLLRVDTALDTDTFLVKQFGGRETVSAPFTYRIELLSIQPRLELKQLVGQPLRLHLGDEFGNRSVHGYVREFASTGQQAQFSAYRVELAPWFAFLDYTCNCRIFQDKTVLQIIEAVFEGYAGLARFRYDLNTGKLQPLSYCVQYNESDFAFVSRLLEDAGLYYSFVHDEEGHEMVLSDDSTLSTVHGEPGVVDFVSDQGTLARTGLHRWGARRRVGPSVQTLRSFDFKQPGERLDGNQGNQVPLGLLPPLEQYRYDGAARFANSRVGQALAAVRNEEAAWPTKLFECSGNAGELQAGGCFTLERHPDFIGRDEADRSFFVVAVQREGHNNFASDFASAEAPSMEMQAEVLRRHVPYRPLRQTPWPRMPGPQTATVVGPPGEELHADAYGRVKVQFHWDRDLDRRENASCWIRSASPWAGADMGGVSPPRVGQEVIVDFLDGDPDRPIITGRVYNEDNMPPFGMEVSGLKSKTVKGAGWNEITMHDGAGGELLNMRAQRDMVTTVLNDQNASVKNNKSTSVAVNHRMDVGANQDISVGGNRGITITGTDLLGVTGTRTSNVTGAVTEKYEAGETKTISAAGYTETITGDFRTTLTGNYTSQRTGTWTETVTSTSSRTVGGLVTETLKAAREVTITGHDTRKVQGKVDDSNVGERVIDVTGNFSQDSTGTHTQGSDGDMTLESAVKLSSKVGGSVIEITSSAIKITAGGSEVVIDASGVSVNGSEIKLNC
ncbi:type VI secretion system tip protein TssI/VgrG [Stenotrophomonas sp. 24(2023)]|uniref:type VI secretion system Vgr family protein n=1 Tax=Stenotrophomonas sp. 24(2023) TaxID=3068324 RepID=UPI0027E171AE|nr:type VI secretion system tip protein TssI/VgrG [Stenotrophomonas sp. 24(2023)]WMJ69049.1 type VI secretion system tip protein TssI/VgrG [Stenotrophomonas sp. 24(2023)]